MKSPIVTSVNRIRVTPGDADRLVLAPRFRQPRVQADLQVHLLVQRAGVADGRQRGRIGPEVVKQHPAQRPVLRASRANRPVHQLARQPADIREFRLIVRRCLAKRCHSPYFNPSPATARTR
jgi:hypothetical protein